MADRFAAIDCGTNSTRLLVTEQDGTTVERLMRVTRLGQGVAETGELIPEAIDRTVAVLREYSGVMERLGVSADPVHLRVTATSAARDAANRTRFFEAAREATDVEAELLGGEEEARLSFVGATHQLDPTYGPFLVVDIGGGSTELAVGSSECEGAVSMDVGCVRLTETYLRSDPPLPEELHGCLSVVRSHLEDAVRELPTAFETRRLVGLAGTVTTVAAVELGLQSYDRDAVHHFLLSRAAAEDVFRTLASEPIADRRHNPGLEPGRVDVIVGGCCVLQAIFRFFGFRECLVSEDDILNGLVHSLLDRG